MLPELTEVGLAEVDLEQLGVVLGHRKRMLRAIAALGAPAAQPTSPPETRLSGAS